MLFDSLLEALKKLVRVDIQDFEIFSKDLQHVQLKKNEIWEQEDKISHFMGFVKSGLLRQYSNKDGVEFTTNFFMENDFAGNYVSYETQTPSTTITAALEPSELFVIPFSVLQAYHRSIPSTKEAADLIGKTKLLQVHERNSSLLMNTPEERYYQLVKEKPALLNRVPQYLIAQYLGIRPETLSRIRKRHKN